jgi:Protein of unknown function DUF262
VSAPDLQVIEEHEENKGTGVEFDPEAEDLDVSSPYDPKLIRVDPKVYSVRQVLDMIEDTELDISPEFQRRRVWKPLQKSRLIESLLLRIPLPTFYFSSDDDGLLQVVDGIQRLSTIFEFVRGESFPLQHLEYLKSELENKTFKDIDKTLWARRIHNTQISVNVIDPQTPNHVKFDIFKRINTGGTPLNAQEIRHCMSRKRSREFLRILSESKAFNEATGYSLYNHVRMVDRELPLRFCAFQALDDISEYANYKSMDDFLTEATRNLDNDERTSDDFLSYLNQSFRTAMSNAKLIFGQHAFRKWPNDSNYLLPINRALFESWSVILSKYDATILRPSKEAIVRKARELMTKDDEFIAAISVGTSSPQRVEIRFRKLAEILGGMAK